MPRTAGFDGIAGMDHMAPPLAEAPAHVRGDDLHHLAGRATPPASPSARSCCVTPSATRRSWPGRRSRSTTPRVAASSSGIGWGRSPASSTSSASARPRPRFRVSRLKESLDIITALWRGESFDYEGEHFTLRSAHSSARHRSSAFPSSSAGRARRRWSWSPPTRTGGTCTSGSWTATTRCGPRPGGHGCRCRCRTPLVASEDRAAKRSWRRPSAASASGSWPGSPASWSTISAALDGRGTSNASTSGSPTSPRSRRSPNSVHGVIGPLRPS